METNRLVWAAGGVLALIALGVWGLEHTSVKEDKLGPANLSMQQALREKRGQAPILQPDALSLAVERKTMRRTEASIDETCRELEAKGLRCVPAEDETIATKENDDDILCQQIRAAGGECETASSKATYSKTTVETQQKDTPQPPSDLAKVSYGSSRPSDEPRRYESSESPGESRFAQLSRYHGKVSSVQGASRVLEVPAIKAGCTLLAKLESGIKVASEQRQGITFIVKGPLHGCQIPKDFSMKLVGTAQLNAIQKAVKVDINTCTSTHTNVRSQSCKASVMSISRAGGDLEGDIYDVSGWGIFWETVLSIATAPTLAKLTETAATANTIWTAEAASMVSATLSDSLSRIGQKISKTFEGREIVVPEGAWVQIKILEDFVY